MNVVDRRIRDLTPRWLEAERAGRWTEERVWALAERVRVVLPGTQVDWDPPDEAWALIVASTGAARVCARVPIAFVEEPFDPELLQPMSVIEVVASFDEPYFRIDRAVIERAFGRDVSTGVDFERMSANDLWWATVT